MMNRINQFALLLLMMCFSLSVSAASEAEYKKLSKTWTLNADGSQSFRYNMELTLFTHAAMNSRYGESFIVYNPQYQTLKINESYTKQKNGNIVKTPANAFVEVLPKNAADAPAYNHLKEMVVVHTGLELGATICLDYTLTSKPGYLPELDIFESLQQSSPVREYTLTMVTPMDKSLQYTLQNHSAQPMVKEEGGQRSTTWTLRNLPQLPTDAFVSVANGDLPYLAATTYANIEEALQTLNKQMDAVGPQIQALAAKLTKDSKCKKCQIKAIVNYVAHQVAPNALTLEQTGYRFRPTDAVLSSVFGTEAEKANLLAALLKAAGFKAEVLAGYPVDAPKGLALNAINHLYVTILGQEPIILPVASLTRPQQVIFGQSPVYKISNGSRLLVPVAENYQLVAEQQVSVKEDQWMMVTEEKIGADLLPYFSKKQEPKSTNQPMKVQQGYTTLVLEESSQAFSHFGYGHLNSGRKVNLLLPRKVDEAYTYTVTCPDNMQLRTPAGKQEIHNAAGDLVISVEKNGQQATIKRSLKLAKQLYTPTEYQALRTLLITWSDVNSKTLLFSVK